MAVFIALAYIHWGALYSLSVFVGQTLPPETV